MRAPRPGGIAVVILTFDQRESTLRCLEHLLPLRGVEADFEVLIWDNGSSDGTAEAVRARHPEVVVEESPSNLGVAGGRNAGAAAAMERFDPALLLFVDNDMAVLPGFVAELAAPLLENPRIGQTQAKLLLSDAPDTIDDAGGCDLRYWKGSTRPVGWGEVDRGQYDRSVRCLPCGGAMMVRAELFRRLEGFDEIFNPYGPEDLDFSLRVREAGCESWFVPTAVAHHDRTHTFGKSHYSVEYGRHRSRHWLELMKRHAGPLDWLGFLLIGVPLVGLRVLWREGRKGNLDALRGLARGVFDSRRSPER